MKSKTAPLLLILGTALGLYAGDGVAQSQAPEKWLPVTVCDLVKNHSHDGERVMFHAKVIYGGLHGMLLKDDRCKGGIVMTGSESAPEAEGYTEFMRAVSSAEKTLDPVITADFYGKFVYRPAEPRLKWALDVERISNVEVKEGKAGTGSTPH